MRKISTDAVELNLVNVGEAALNVFVGVRPQIGWMKDKSHAVVLGLGGLNVRDVNYSIGDIRTGQMVIVSEHPDWGVTT